MKNKTIKNIGIMVGTSNLAFASGTSGKGNKIVDEKLEDKDEFKNILEILKNNTNKDVDSIQLTKDIFSNLYKCTKKKDENLKKNILNYSLNFEIKIENVKKIFKGKIKIDKDKKNIIVLKKNPIFLPLQDTEEKILNIYKSLLNEECIILELDNNGVVDKLYNTTINEDKKKLSDKIKEKLYDTKELFESVLSNNAIENNQNINIIKSLNENKLGFGLHDSATYSIELDGYIIIDVDKKDKDMLSGTIEKNIQASIKSNISSIAINGTTNNLSPEDVIIAQKQINGKKKLLIAKAENVSECKIGQQMIYSEFYKSSLEEFFNTVNKLEEEENPYKALIKIFIDNKYDCGQYQLDEATIKNMRSQISKDINLNNKGLEWICLREKETTGGSFNTDVFKRNIDFTGKNQATKVISNGMETGGCFLKENDIVVAIESNKNLLLIAKGSDISAGTVNGQTIDKNFYAKPNPVQ